jgi:hypothetical protein
VPTLVEIDQAYLQGFAAIDDGFTFMVGFSEYLMGLGYRFEELGPCTCSDGGSHGHLTECRWIK